jgi:hypothetical protein
VGVGAPLSKSVFRRLERDALIDAEVIDLVRERGLK